MKIMQDPYKIETEYLKKTIPMMRYDGTETPEAWQERARGVLGELLGLSKFHRCEDDFAIEYEKNHEDGVREIRFSLQTEEGYRTPAVLLIPPDRKVPMPVMICLQGHSTGMHISLGRPIYPSDAATISGGDRDFALRAVKEGYAALAVEQRAFGECGNKENGYPRCYEPAMTALLTGRTLLGARIWDLMRVVDNLYRFPELDTDRVLCMGNSGGGTATTYFAAMDPRVAAAMPSCAVCDFDRSIGIMNHCACNYVPRMAEYFDMGDLVAMIAPRPLVVINGAKDDIFLQDGVAHAVEVGRAVYREMKAEGKLRRGEGPEGHRFYADIAWPLLHEVFPQGKN